MSAITPRLQSGKFHERPMLPVCIRRRPFADRPVPDVATKTYEQHYTVTRARYSPFLAVRSPAPPTFSGAFLGRGDSSDTAAYLVAETDPDEDIIDAILARVKRVFSYVPVDQVSYIKRPFSRPAMHDNYLATPVPVWAVSFDQLLTSTLLFSRLPVLSINTVAAITTTGSLTSSTIHFVDGGAHTCDMAANVSAATAISTLSAALTSLSAINASKSTLGDLSLVWTGTMSSITTPAGVNILGLTSYSVTFVSTGTVTSPASTTIAATSHGFFVGDLVALWAGNSLFGTGMVITVNSADSFSMMSTDLQASTSLVTHCQGAKYGLRLANGTKDIAVRSTEKYYLPGVTAGIATAANIPGIPVYTDPIGWLGRICATTLTSVVATAATNRFNKTSHGLTTGDTFFVIDRGTGAAAVSTLTQYWAIVVDANNWQAAKTVALAIAGTNISVGTDSTGMTILVPAPYAEIQVTDSTQWKGSIMMKTAAAAQLADALETRDPSA